MRYFERGPFVPITERPKLSWPNGARLAVWVVPNIEFFEEDLLVGMTISSTGARATPDIPNYTWRDYGLRVGIWRQMEMLKELAIPGTVALNSLVCEVYPSVVRACMELGWEFMGHGRTNSESLNGMDEHRERDVIAEVLSRIEAFTGRWPAGWLGPGLAETNRTLDILAEYGVRYTADWVNDEQPHRLQTTHGEIVSLPYSNEINDIGVFRRGQTGAEFAAIIKDQFDQLYEDSAQTGRVMCVALHPYITGVPHRARHLKAALKYMRAQTGVWFATGSEILAAYEACTRGNPSGP